MKVASMLLAALSLSAATAASDSNIRGSSVMDDDGEQLSISKSRQLQKEYDATSTNDAPLSGGTWLFYLMLNAILFPFDAAGYGCNSCNDDATTTTTYNNNYYEDNNRGARTLWESDSWSDDGYNHQSSSTSSSSSSSSQHSSSSRCKAPHAPKLKSPPKPPSSPQKHNSSSASGSSGSSSGGGGSSSHSYSTWTHDGYDYDAPAWATDGYDESSIHVSHLTDGNGSNNIGSAATMGMIVGVAVAALAAIAAAAFMMKKGCFKNGIAPSRWNQNKPDVDANTLSDTDDSSRSDDDDDDINRDNYIEMTDLQYEELARADDNSHGVGHTGKLMERLGALRSSANMVFCPAKMLCPSKNTATV